MILRLYEAPAWDAMGSLRVRLLHLELGLEVRETEGKNTVCVWVGGW